MSSVLDDILNARLDVLEDKCTGVNILSKDCQKSFQGIDDERAAKFYSMNMELECRKDFNNENCKNYIVSDNGKNVANFLNTYCGSRRNFLSKDCFKACSGGLRSLMDTCTEQSNIFIFIILIIWVILFVYFRISKIYSKRSNNKK
jgi:hypothetical protein